MKLTIFLRHKHDEKKGLLSFKINKHYSCTKAHSTPLGSPVCLKDGVLCGDRKGTKNKSSNIPENILGTSQQQKATMERAINITLKIKSIQIRSNWKNIILCIKVLLFEITLFWVFFGYLDVVEIDNGDRP